MGTGLAVVVCYRRYWAGCMCIIMSSDFYVGLRNSLAVCDWVLA